MVRSKARFSYKQYIRNKPTQWGFKLWCLCDPHTGYTVRFAVYRGKEGEITSGNGLGYDVVFKLMQDYLDQGYSVQVNLKIVNCGVAYRDCIKRHGDKTWI